MKGSNRLVRILAVLAMLAVAPFAAAASAPAGTVDRNVVFGMYSGLALLMDVYRPAKPNGAGIVAIQGSAWYAPMRYDATPISSRAGVQAHARHLADAGYVVFAINHRAAPRFRFPAPFEDAQRAVRFVRAHAADYGIDPARIGAFGSSSGGHLAELLGTVDAPGVPGSADPVERQPGKVRAVVAHYATSDLRTQWSPTGRAAHIALMGFEYVDPAKRLPGSVREDEAENVEYRRASPVANVTSDDAPMLLIHGDADDIVPIGQSIQMEEALRKAGVKVRFVTVPGGKHGENFQLPADDARLSDQYGEARRWFDQYLK
jgi:acetyl esterase/lipase